MEVEKMRSQELMTLGSTLVILGIVFGEDRLIGYSFIGAGVLLSIINAFRLKKKTRTQSHRTGGI
jgi:predicted Kef-type K+ transport protein